MDSVCLAAIIGTGWVVVATIQVGDGLDVIANRDLNLVTATRFGGGQWATYNCRGSYAIDYTSGKIVYENDANLMRIRTE